MSPMLLLVYRHAVARAEPSRLNVHERLLTRLEMAAMLILCAFAVLSIGVALVIPPHLGWLLGISMIYALLAQAMMCFSVLCGRRLKQLEYEVAK
jgi:hypothetical protein